MKTIVSSGFLAAPIVRGAEHQPHSIALPYPAIEALPEFAGVIDSGRLQPASRHYNGSICRWNNRTFLAYRYEQFDAVSKVGLCELDSEFTVIGDTEIPIASMEAVHYEDPRLTVVGSQLILQFAHVRLGVPPICRQRMVELMVLPGADFRVRVEDEIPLPFGGHGIEKNWSPFELPNGAIGLVYGQSPRLVIEVPTRAGAWSHATTIKPEGSSLSGRTPPLRINNDSFLEFVGGHVPCQPRNHRYWFGAQLFQAAHPHHVTASTGPLVWGTEASRTIFSPRPFAGHPLCIFPSGIMREGDDVIISCGVNDSFIALLRYNVAELLEKMQPASLPE